MPSTPLSNNPTINALLSTYQWGTQNRQSASVTFSFPGANAVWSSTYTTEIAAGWSVLSTAQQVDFKKALAAWSDVANIRFTEVPENQSSVGDIRVAFSNAVKNQGYAGWAYYPVSKAQPQSGDVWLSPNDTDFSPGSQGYHTMLHELGHALGLKHSFSAVTGNPAVLTGSKDSNQYTLMSYTDYQGAGYIFIALGGGSYSYYAVQPTTPMLYDIAAIQFLYGANMTTRTGNDTYTFSNTHGEIKTIWDAGGVDTFSLSNQTVSQTIDLNAGHFSSLGVKQLTPGGALSTATANIAIAYNVSIENAIGGKANDTIIGNALNNILTGGAGNDTIKGNPGNDKLNGGIGNDKLAGGIGNDIYVVDSGSDIVTELTNAGTDTVQSYVSWTLGANIERLTLLGNIAINGTGNGLDNIITGNTAKNTLKGGIGNDKLIGGAGSDQLTGGAGKDVFLFNSLSGIDKITDFSVVSDTIQLENAVFRSLTSTGVLAADQFTFGSLAADNNDFLIYNQGNGALYYDADGTGVKPETQIATLGVSLALTSADFVVV